MWWVFMKYWFKKYFTISFEFESSFKYFNTPEVFFSRAKAADEPDITSVSKPQDWDSKNNAHSFDD